MRQIRNWYRLLEGTGLVANDSGPGQATGTLTANVTWNPYEFPPGTPYDYKGVVIASSVSRISSAAASGFNASEGSIEMLVRPSWNYDDGILHHFFDTYDGNNRRFTLRKDIASTTSLLTDSTVRGTFTFPWSSGSLYHVVLNWGTNELWINDVLFKDFSDGDLGLGSSNLFIGDRYSGSSFSFNGVIYYFIVRDSPLTESEIAIFRSFFEEQYITNT